MLTKQGLCGEACASQMKRYAAMARSLPAGSAQSVRERGALLINDPPGILAAIICIALVVAVTLCVGRMGFWKRSARYNQTLSGTTLYHYVRNQHRIEQDDHGVVIRPRYRVDAKGHQTAWSTVVSKKKPFTFFYRGRTGEGASYNFTQDELDDSMQLVVINGDDFEKFLHGRTVYTRRKDKTIASPYGYTGPARIHQVHLREDRSKLDDSHLNEQKHQ